jgi:hypothetical protein
VEGTKWWKGESAEKMKAKLDLFLLDIWDYLFFPCQDTEKVKAFIYLSILWRPFLLFPYLLAWLSISYLMHRPTAWFSLCSSTKDFPWVEGFCRFFGGGEGNKVPPFWSVVEARTKWITGMI